MLLRFEPFVDRDILGGGVHLVPVDAYRLGDRFYLHLDIPGVDPESIEVTVEKNSLAVSAERVVAHPEAGEGSWIIRERPQGSFSRRFMLGEALDTERIEAGYDHGVLTISIPVAEQAKPRKINIGVTDKALVG
jgi:HSP20 family protein